MSMWSWFRRNVARTRPADERKSLHAAASSQASLRGDAQALRSQAAGLVAQGRYEAAAALHRQALELDPASAGGWVHLGHTLYAAGRFGEAQAALSRALTLDARDADALYLLGGALRAQGDPAGAIDRYRQALAVQPDFEPCRIDLALTQIDCGKLVPARTVVDDGLRHAPGSGNLLHLRGNLERQAGEIDAAISSYMQALVQIPRAAVVHLNLAKALQARGDTDGAIASYAVALQNDPALVDAYVASGALRYEQGDLTGAVQCCRQGLAVAPDQPDLLGNLGAALTGLGQLDEASAVLQSAVAAAPDRAGLHGNLGIVQRELGELAAAVTSLRRALALEPASAAAHANLGAVLQERGEHDAALAEYRAALALDPALDDAQNNLLFTLNYHPDLSAQAIYAAYREYDERVGMPLCSTWRAHVNPRSTDRRLKVGYVSPDFCLHSVRHFLEPLLGNHDRRAVEVYAYAELSREDAVTARYRTYVDHWVPTVGLSDAALADRIRADGIDILVDVAGHTAKNRLGTFARKPAPVSLTWMGFGYTTGLGAIDYMLTDRASAPEGSEELFAERPWRLDTSAWAFRPAEGMGAVSALPAISNGHVTFGTLTRSVRINHHSIRVWSQLLSRVTGSRLVVDSKNYQDAQMRSALIDKFASHGVDADRLQIGFRSPPWDVLRSMDIGLDCFPHNSGTTLFESLYMGVPFVTLAGRPSVGRLGSSILHGVGHPEWIARSEDGYVELAVALASDLPRLAQLRGRLRAEMAASPLRDEVGFARKVEAAYRDMFASWVAGARGTATP